LKPCKLNNSVKLYTPHKDLQNCSNKFPPRSFSTATQFPMNTAGLLRPPYTHEGARSGVNVRYSWQIQRTPERWEDFSPDTAVAMEREWRLFQPAFIAHGNALVPDAAITTKYVVDLETMRASEWGKTTVFAVQRVVLSTEP